MTTLHKVHSVKATATSGVYEVDATITTLDEDVNRDIFISRHDDPYGIGPSVRQWLEMNPEFPFIPYEPQLPTPEEVRARMPSLTVRQLRLGLITNGCSLSTVDTAIAAIPDPNQREYGKVEWEYATSFNRMHPLIATIGAALGLSDTQIDAMWLAAVSL